MRGVIKNMMGFVVVISFTACNYFTFSLKSKKNKVREQPSLLIYDRIVDFRLEQMSWPISKHDFISKGIKYHEVFKDFPYQQTTFKIIDSNTMIFSFYDHIKDQLELKRTNKIDLNSYAGSVRFYKENGKFLWKVKIK
jgi:hypothetical protein